MLALTLKRLPWTDGAGVDVRQHKAWDCAPPRQTRSWVIAPTGRTEWVRYRTTLINTCADQFTTGSGLARPKYPGCMGIRRSSVAHLDTAGPVARLELSCRHKGGHGWTLEWWARNMVHSRAISGQSISRYAASLLHPTIAHIFDVAVPAAAYVKSQSYVSWVQSR